MRAKAQTPIWVVLLLVTFCRSQESLWTELHSPNFTLTTNVSETEARHALFALEQLRAILPARRDTRLLELFLFRDASDVARYAPGERSAGFLREGSPDERVIAVAAGSRPLLHEYVHFAMPARAPIWSSEGIAQYYSMLRVAGDRVTIGIPDEDALAFLRTSKLPAAADLAKVRRDSPPETFYPQAWALMHLLMANRQELDIGYENLDRHLAMHIANGAPGGERVFSAASMDRNSFVWRSLPPAEARLRLIGLLPIADRAPALRALAQNHPDFAPAWEDLGLRFLAANRFDQALEAYDKAIALGSLQPQTLYLAGILHRHYSRDESGDDLLIQAAALDPEYLPAARYVAAVREEREEMRLRRRALAPQDHAFVERPLPEVKLAAAAKPAKPKTPPEKIPPEKTPPDTPRARQGLKPTPSGTWIFAGAKLIGCSGSPEKRVCTYSR